MTREEIETIQMFKRYHSGDPNVRWQLSQIQFCEDCGNSWFHHNNNALHSRGLCIWEKKYEPI